MRNRCNGCRGEYDTVAPDGSSYAHVCPPELVIAITRAGAELEVPIGELRPDDVIAVSRGGQVARVAVSAIAADDVRVGERFRLRADHRNENPDPRARPGVRSLIAEGRGATTLRA